MDRLIIYGTGSGAAKFIEIISKENTDYNFEIVCFVDSFPGKWDTFFYNKSVISPLKINSMDFDYIIIASIYFSEIKKDLVEKFGILSKKIISKEKYIGERNVKKIYNNKYKSVNSSKNKLKNSEKIVVYTANIGNYDIVKNPLVKDKNIDYILFTDNCNYKSDVWNVKYVHNNFESTVQCARYYKIFAYKLFPEYQYSVWVDSKFLIVGNFRDYIHKYYRDESLLCFPHPLRDNIYDEADACIECGKVDLDEINKQVMQYKKEGLPLKHGLIDSGCLVRKHNDSKLIKIMENWWDELNAYTMRDQISFPYVVWKNDFRYDICDMFIEQCDYLQIHACHGNKGHYNER